MSRYHLLLRWNENSLPGFFASWTRTNRGTDTIRYTNSISCTTIGARQFSIATNLHRVSPRVIVDRESWMLTLRERHSSHYFPYEVSISLHVCSAWGNLALWHVQQYWWLRWQYHYTYRSSCWIVGHGLSGTSSVFFHAASCSPEV